MSNLPGNPHYAAAASQMDVVEDMTIQEVLQAEATLALAYEQRTATLVQALLDDSLVIDGQYDEVQAAVRQRLGMKEAS